MACYDCLTFVVSTERSETLILDAVRAIPIGQVSSYGAIAARAGLPKRARLVARVLANLPDGNNVPWHRVLRASGHIAFPVDSADFQRQKNKLLAEGCSVTTKGLVIAAIAVDDSLDSQLWSGFFRP